MQWSRLNNLRWLCVCVLQTQWSTSIDTAKTCTARNRKRSQLSGHACMVKFCSQIPSVQKTTTRSNERRCSLTICNIFKSMMGSFLESTFCFFCCCFFLFVCQVCFLLTFVWAVFGFLLSVTYHTVLTYCIWHDPKSSPHARPLHSVLDVKPLHMRRCWTYIWFKNINIACFKWKGYVNLHRRV